MTESLPMQCTSCGHHNTDEARFCSRCGNPLGLVCPACATWNEPASRYCSNCGTGLAAGMAPRDNDDLSRYVPEELLHRIRAAHAGGAMLGERRTVTMLFADIQGSTAAAEQLDPEEWAEIINGAFAHLIAPIYRYEGTLARLQGDAILAFFGAPIAHEDDPLRAVRAGLDIVAAIAGYRRTVEARHGVPIAVRVGINTGLVVVGEVGSDLRVEYTALGDAINVAARMEQTAEPGSVRITEHTANVLRGMFELTDIGPVEVKGRAEPVRAFRVGAAVSEAAGHHRATPLVGRDGELAALRRAGDRLVAGVGNVCSLVGEAGIGKSRLLSVLRSDLETRAVVVTWAATAGGDLAWLAGRSRSFDVSVPYATFAQVLRSWWELEEGPPAQAWDLIMAAVERAFGAPDADSAAFLATVVGVTPPQNHNEVVTTLETPVLYRRTTDAIAAYLEAEATRQPMLVVLDDLQWSDALSLALVERLLQLTETAALGLVLAMRPQREDASWRLLETAAREYGHRYTAVQLEALPDAATLQLLTELLGDTALDDNARQRVLDRANGNPLFIEELVRSLGDSPPPQERMLPFADPIDVPASLASLLTARLDQLDETARRVAQVAAVVGRELNPRPLAALLHDVDVPTAIAELVRRGILIERRRVPEPLYAFRHALIQETAYSTVLLRTRRALHSRLAQYLETAQPQAIQEIARHHLEANARDKAFPYLVLAGEHATRAMALADAIRLFTTALDAVPADAEAELVARAHDGLGEAYNLIPDLPRASATYQRLLDYARSSDQPSLQVLALNRLGVTTATHTADFLRAEQYLADARRVAEACGDELGLAEYHMNSCLLAVMQGELDKAIEHDVEAARLGGKHRSLEIRLDGLTRRALNLFSTTQYAEAEPAAREAIAAADELGATELACVLRTTSGVELALRDGDLRRAQQALVDGLPTLDRFGSFHAASLRVHAADVALYLGDVEGAIAEAGAARRTAEQLDQAFAGGVAAAFMAHVYALCGITESQAQLREVALASLAPPRGDLLASTTWAHLGWTNLALGRLEQAADDLAVGLRASSTTRFWERPRLLIGSAFAALEHADLAAAHRLLDEAGTYVAERAIRLHDPDLALASGRVALAEDRVDESAAAFERAARLATEQQRPLLARDVAAAHYQLARRTGRHDEAERHLQRSRSLSHQIAATIADEQLREAFLARSAVPADQPGREPAVLAEQPGPVTARDDG